MLKSLNLLQFFGVCLLAFALGTTSAWAQSILSLGIGRVALTQEVDAWNTDIRPDGQGLPVGSGSVLVGEEIYFEQCASCHGDFGEAVGRWPALAGGEASLDGDDPVKTIGSYWPYLSTVFDYVRRAMPYGEARSLSDDDVYAVTAYLLFLNDLVDEGFELTRENFTDIRLPNEGNFYLDDRTEGELVQFGNSACMADCKVHVQITGRALALNVTPGGG